MERNTLFFHPRMKMNEYDVIIVGAGPAGGQCARKLAAAGKKILLIERHRNFTINSYSSAGAPEQIMQMFHLPENIIGSDWNKIRIHSSHHTHMWESKKRGGVVMDFAKLRSFLAEDAQKHGGEVRLSTSYIDYQSYNNVVVVDFRCQNTQKLLKLKTKILVDATGADRQVLAKKKGFIGNWFSSTGIEYLVNVSPDVYEKWKKTLSFFMGHAWMPQGYSWIFPMQPNQLKVGVGRYFQNETYVPYEKSYRHYLHLLMEKCLGSSRLPVLDKHGKTIVYSYKRNDIHFEQNVIAIGDSVSTINPLAFEGIRHAMSGASVAAKHILAKLDGDNEAFKKYKEELSSSFGFKWKLCELLMKMIYREPSDEKVDLMLLAWKPFSFEEMIHIAFDYKPFLAARFLANYAVLVGKKKLRTLIGG